MWLILVASLIGIPIVHYAIEQWLESFAYRVVLIPEFYFVPIMSVVILLTITVGYQVIKAAFINPVETLRYE